MRTIRILFSVLWICAIAGTQAMAQTSGVRLISTGDFTDSSGSVHTWKVNGAHTLIWDGQPYIPVGGVFYSRYVCLGQTDENWQADTRALETIKGKGIMDLLLRAIGPATSTKPAAWQKLMDYLDSSGFTYGIDLADGPKSSLDGVSVEASRYRLEDVSGGAALAFDIPDVASAFWVLSNSDGEVISNGGATVSGGKVKLQVKGSSDQNGVLILYPMREFGDTSQTPVSDLWGGFDEYRDRLIAFLSGLKFGKGLRFFVDPISGRLDFSGDLDSVVPDSAGFRLEFESYLTKKYKNIGSLNAAWNLAGEQISTFEEAARSIPLWHGPKGISAIYDKARAQRYRVDATRCSIWEDIITFRGSSVRGYMNSAADLLKRNGANVPVVYKASSYNSVYVNVIEKGGFDGLATESYGHGQELVADSAGPIYSLAEESSRTMWFVVTGTQDTSRPDKAASGYPSRNGLFADLDSLAEVGAKGIFTLGMQVLPEDAWKKHSLVLVPEQLDWLKEFKDQYAAADRADYLPKVLSFPQNVIVGAAPMRLAPGTWWLPSLRPGTAVELGDAIGAYTMPGLGGLCMWSRSGPTVVTLMTAPGKLPGLVFPTPGEGILTVQKKDRAVVKLSGNPVVVSGLNGDQAYPYEAGEAEIPRLEATIAQAKAANLRTAASENDLKRAKDMLKKGLVRISYSIAHGHVQTLKSQMGTYVWIEAERSSSFNFGSIVSTPSVSAGAYLQVDTRTGPVMAPYTADYTFVASNQSEHEIWIAGLGPENGASPMSFSIDAGPWQQASFAPPISAYGPAFAWYRIGYVSPSKGAHSLRLKVDGPGSGGRYKAAIDAIVLSPGQFKPSGIVKP